MQFVVVHVSKSNESALIATDSVTELGEQREKLFLLPRAVMAIAGTCSIEAVEGWFMTLAKDTQVTCGTRVMADYERLLAIHFCESDTPDEPGKHLIHCCWDVRKERPLVFSLECRRGACPEVISTSTWFEPADIVTGADQLLYQGSMFDLAALFRLALVSDRREGALSALGNDLSIGHVGPFGVGGNHIQLQL